MANLPIHHKDCQIVLELAECGGSDAGVATETSSVETLRSVPYSALVPRSIAGLSSVSDLRLAFNWQMIDGLVEDLFSAIFIISRLLTEFDIFDNFVDCFTICTNWTVLTPSTI